MIEKLSARYELSENVTSQMLNILDDVGHCEYSLKDDKYSVMVVKRENDFDIKLYRAVMTENTGEDLACNEQK